MPHQKSILIVEDDIQEAAFLKQTLRALYSVQVVDRGTSAYNLLSSGNEFDLIILDIRMPGMTGDRLLKAIRQMGNTTEVLVLTSFDEADIAVSTLSDGAFEYLTKPIKKDRLLAKVAEAIETAELKKSENIELLYQKRRQQFKQNFVQSFSKAHEEEEFSNRPVGDEYFEMLSRKRFR